MKIIISPTTAVVLRAGGKTHGAPDGGIRVPTILKWPGKVASGQVTDEPVSLMDVLPTIARAVHAQLPANHVVDGKDLLPLLTGDEGRSPHEFLFHYCQDRVDAVRYRPREGEWTLGRENKHVSPWSFCCSAPPLNTLGVQGMSEQLLVVKSTKQNSSREMYSPIRRHKKNNEKHKRFRHMGFVWCGREIENNKREKQ